MSTDPRQAESVVAAAAATRLWRAAQTREVETRLARNAAWRTALDDGHSVAAIARAADDSRDLIHVWKGSRKWRGI